MLKTAQRVRLKCLSSLNLHANKISALKINCDPLNKHSLTRTLRRDRYDGHQVKRNVRILRRSFSRGKTDENIFKVNENRSGGLKTCLVSLQRMQLPKHEWTLDAT